VLLARLHQLQGFIHLFLESFSVGHELFLGIPVTQSPVVLFTTDQWIVDVFNHIAEHSNRIGRHLTEENLFVAGFVDIDLTLM
jgi:hypothetical protein